MTCLKYLPIAVSMLMTYSTATAAALQNNNMYLPPTDRKTVREADDREEVGLYSRRDQNYYILHVLIVPTPPLLISKLSLRIK